MDTRDLTFTRARECDLCLAVARAAAAVVALTGIGVLAGAVWSALASSSPPHPVLTGGVGDALAILVNNLRVLAAPFLLLLFRFHLNRLGRLTGDLLVLGGVAVNTLTVGIELGRWGGALLPYIPQLPLEWTALALSVATWMIARNNRADRFQITALACTIGALLTVSAGLETWCTPRTQTSPRLIAGRPDIALLPIAPVDAGGCLRPGFCADPGQPASRSPIASFPSQRSVPLGLFVGADRAHVNHRPPLGGINGWTSTS